jgi:hypothetical protein
MRLVLLLLLATCLTGCVLQFPFACEDETASICSLQRRSIFAPRDKPAGARTSARREAVLPDDAPQSPPLAIALIGPVSRQPASCRESEPNSRIVTSSPGGTAARTADAVGVVVYV